MAILACAFVVGNTPGQALSLAGDLCRQGVTQLSDRRHVYARGAIHAKPEAHPRQTHPGKSTQWAEQVLVFTGMRVRREQRISKLVPAEGFEPPTLDLQDRRSTTELRRQGPRERGRCLDTGHRAAAQASGMRRGARAGRAPCPVPAVQSRTLPSIDDRMPCMIRLPSSWRSSSYQAAVAAGSRAWVTSQRRRAFSTSPAARVVRFFS